MLKFSIALVIICFLIETIEGLERSTHSLKTKPNDSKRAASQSLKDKPMMKNYENIKFKKSDKYRTEVKPVASRFLRNEEKPTTILPKKSAGRIINGTRADKASFPFLVSIQAHNVSYDTWNHGCGGSIVTQTIVLTACHCIGLIVGDVIIYGNFKRLRIVAGTDSLERLASTAQIREVNASIAHPKCSNFPDNENGWFGSDVSLLLMSTPFKFNGHVQPMKLFSRDNRRALQKLKQMVEQGKSCVVPGWGSTVEFEVQHPEFLMASKVKLIPDESCRALYCERTRRHCSTDFNLAGQVCGVSEHSSDCQGDSGGPLVCEGKLFGTVSYGERCIAGWPSVFQGVRPILELLKKYTASRRLGSLLGQKTIQPRKRPRKIPKEN